MSAFHPFATLRHNVMIARIAHRMFKPPSATGKMVANARKRDVLRVVIEQEPGRGSALRGAIPVMRRASIPWILFGAFSQGAKQQMVAKIKLGEPFPQRMRIARGKRPMLAPLLPMTHRRCSPPGDCLSRTGDLSAARDFQHQ